ncbi:bifunctional serine/threonine-protein kinase/formylglycine-generating enzyme family protein [Rivularia sp. UHCC 0363]|uniref:bifunctional serine/threonine-protein kinase/formylglycine-generating enzyme family protein n=1 Tax=Rivularia sp. UHCC 0363 TaxID=3110244 RepID=UPI002B1EEF81|nr:bifunctional serine/threonine-protein kinase/formylglycine-generating enzyme family protein [Rivularia sp. UHCC 0363]MEA5596586.1 bifunctional serine/threonine-protein kinase/formylglycine-generating enzyme family protein [Rivularia sp. UHCC 0363]
MQLWTSNQQLQNGNFTIQKVLGGGGFGITYSAIEKNTNNIVAIKTLNPIHQSKGDFEQQQVKFVQEAFRLVQCSHPHIVKVHEVINENGLWGMVMEYISGQDLAVYINQRGKLSEVEALKYINQVGTALEYIHQQGMLHRDVKPNNIVLRQSQQEAVLIDFGLAREFDLNKTGSMTNSMTEGYAPIEQYERRGKFGAYTDVYALAATLYTLLTGEAPLPSRFRITGIPLPSPNQRNPGISDKVNDGIIKGMGLEPHERTQTVREWLELVMPNQVKSFNQNESPKTPQFKPKTLLSVLPIPSLEFLAYLNPCPVEQNNTPKQIHTQKFEFEYAKINEKLEIVYYRGKAEVFIQDLGNGVTLEMVAIPGGNFIMGAPEDEEGSFDFERPQHKVSIQSFFIGKYQVTQEQYQVIMERNPSYFKGKKRPVERVSWDDAVEFCTKLSKLTGKEYRLPSEAEWEYACRAGTITPFHFGETITTELVNYNGNNTYDAAPQGIYRKQTTNIGSFPPNPFGLYDMHGNVWEWCLDDCHENYEGAPRDGSAWVNDNYFYKVLRGGSWYSIPEDCRSATTDKAGCYIGLRVVYVAS